MEWNVEENFSKEWNMQWKVFSMEWKWNGKKLPLWNREKSSSISYRALSPNAGFKILTSYWLMIAQGQHYDVIDWSDYQREKSITISKHDVCGNNWNKRRLRLVFLCFYSAIFKLESAKRQTFAYY